jgi:hypothetical protein
VTDPDADTVIVSELVWERLLLRVPVVVWEEVVEGLLVLEPLGVGVSELLTVMEGLLDASLDCDWEGVGVLELLVEGWTDCVADSLELGVLELLREGWTLGVCVVVTETDVEGLAVADREEVGDWDPGGVGVMDRDGLSLAEGEIERVSEGLLVLDGLALML